jgi:hypothetical protein
VKKQALREGTVKLKSKFLRFNRSEGIKQMVKNERQDDNPSTKSGSKIVKRTSKLPDPSVLLKHGFIARAMVLASMPHSKPQETYFERKNGHYTLALQANQKIGLPYGPIPRLLFAWMTTEAVLTKDRTLVLGKSLAHFMRQLDIAPTGGRNGSITALKEQMKRLFSTMISCTYSNEERDAGVQMLLVDNYDLWWSPKDPEQIGLMDSTITLSEKFFEEITKSPVVFYMEALKALRKSPLALDIYLWLTYKNSYADSPTIISWESLQLQFGSEYQNNSRGKADFKAKFVASLKKVAVVYDDAKKLKVSKGGLKYFPGKPHVSKLGKAS